MSENLRSRRAGRIDASLRELIRGGRIGAPTHVSCIDRRSTAVEDGPTRPEYAQVIAAGADDLDRLCEILGRDPLQILARCSNAAWSRYQHGASTEAFVEMAGGLHVHYSGSLTSNRPEHSLWIEGDQGVLWTNRSLIWWRKRGWPVFIPIPFRGGAAGPESRSWAAAIAEGAIRSDKTKTTVAINSPQTVAGGDSRRAASGQSA